jgi:hypothetical protein
MRKPAFVAACLAMLVFGIVLTTLGAALPSIIARFGIDTSAAGALFLLLTFGILLATVVVGPLADARGYKAILIASCSLIAAGLSVLAFATSSEWIRVAVLAIGFGGGFVNAGANALVADLSAEGHRGSGLSRMDGDLALDWRSQRPTQLQSTLALRTPEYPIRGSACNAITVHETMMNSAAPVNGTTIRSRQVRNTIAPPPISTIRCETKNATNG